MRLNRAAGRMPDNVPRFGTGPALALVIGFLLGGLLYTAPLAHYLDAGLPYAAVPPEGRETVERVQGDYLQFYYYLWLVRDRLLDGTSPLRDPYQFAVGEPRLNLPNTFAPFALLYLPLSLLDPRLAYNALVLLSFPAAGLAAALLAYRYGAGRWGALVAGVVFACGPYRVGTLLGGHPAGLAFFLVPLTLWGLEGALAGSLAGGAWCGAALLSVAIVEPHFFLFAAWGLPLYVLLRVGLAGWTRDACRVGPTYWTTALAVALAVAWGALAAASPRGWSATPGARLGVGVIVALAALVVWQCAAGWLVAAGVAGDARSAARRSLLGALPWFVIALGGTRSGRWVGPAALALPVLTHAAWLLPRWHLARAAVVPLGVAALGALLGAGFLLLVRRLILSGSVASTGRTLGEVLLFSPQAADLTLRVNPAAGRAIYPGVLALALALAGLIALVRRPPGRTRRVLLAFGPLVLLGTGLTLGPRWPALPLFDAAFHLIPFWNFIRQPAKFQVAVALGLAVLAAVGADAAAGRLRGVGLRRVVPLLLALGIAAEYHPWRPAGVSLLPGPDAAVEAIRAVGPRALYIPLWPGDSSYSALYLFTTTLTRVPMLNGYSAYVDRAYVNDVYRALEPINVGHVGDAEYATLRRLGVRQVIVDPDGFPLKVSPFGPALTLAGLRRSPFLEPAPVANHGGALRAFRVRTEPAPTRSPRATSPLGVFWEAESLRRETGQVADDPEASNARVVLGQAGRDRPGFLTFGPYRMLPGGEFRALFRLRGRGAGVELQVTAAGGTRLLGTRPLSLAEDGPLRDVPVAFVLDAPATVEFRTKWDGQGAVAVDLVLAIFASEPDPAPAFEVETLGHELSERADAAASGGVAGYADPARTPRDRVWSGPLRSYPPGRYRLWVRLKVDRVVAGPLVWCGAQAASLGPVLGGRDLLGEEVGTAGRYVEVSVPFALPRATVLELPCRYRGTIGVWFDRLRVEGPLS